MKGSYHYWEPEEIIAYKKLWETSSLDQLAKHYGVSIRTICMINKNLGLIKERGLHLYEKLVGDRAEEYRQLWYTMSNRELMRHYGVSDKVIYRINKELGLWKSQTVKKQSPKKPSKPVGTVSYRMTSLGVRMPFILTDSGWMVMHKYNWLQAGNTIPDGYRLSFIDQDPTNCDISNLILKTPSQIIKDNWFNRADYEPGKRKPSKPRIKRDLNNLQDMFDAPLRRAEERKRRIEEQQANMAKEILFKKDVKRKAKEVRDRQKAEKKKEIARQKAEQQLIAQNRKVSRRKEKPFATIQRDFSKMIAVRIDSRTIMYAKTPEEAERIRAKYIKISPLSKAS